MATEQGIRVKVYEQVVVEVNGGPRHMGDALTLTNDEARELARQLGKVGMGTKVVTVPAGTLSEFDLAKLPADVVVLEQEPTEYAPGWGPAQEQRLTEELDTMRGGLHAAAQQHVDNAVKQRVDAELPLLRDYVDAKVQDTLKPKARPHKERVHMSPVLTRPDTQSAWRDALAQGGPRLWVCDDPLRRHFPVAMEHAIGIQLELHPFTTSLPGNVHTVRVEDLTMDQEQDDATVRVDGALYDLHGALYEFLARIPNHDWPLNATVKLIQERARKA